LLIFIITIIKIIVIIFAIIVDINNPSIPNSNTTKKNILSNRIRKALIIPAMKKYLVNLNHINIY